MKKNYVWIIIIVVFSIVLFLGVYLLIRKLNQDEGTKSNYTKEVVEYIKANKLDEIIFNKPYSQTVETLIVNENFNEKYIDDYYTITYQNKDFFTDVINLLLDKGYIANEINTIIEKYGLSTINKIINNSKFDINYLKLTNFEIDKIDQYLEYQKLNDVPFETIVTYVNIGLNIDFYSQYSAVENAGNNLVLVNKYNKLADEYVPNDLVALSGTMMISERAKDHITELVSDATNEGYYVCYYSGYRSFDLQTRLYNNYVKRDGEKAADLYSARPGFSEHQTGLVIDLCSTDRKTIKENTPLYEWITTNAHKYGFIIRYPKNKTNITGYQFEPWHLRYIGVEHATKVNMLNITYDEYYDLFIKER